MPDEDLSPLDFRVVLTEDYEGSAELLLSRNGELWAEAAGVLRSAKAGHSTNGIAVLLRSVFALLDTTSLGSVGEPAWLKS